MGLWVFEADQQSFHPKAYLFYTGRNRKGSGIAFVGSSNLTHTALTNGIEWNYRTIPTSNEPAFQVARDAFTALLKHALIREADAAWVDTYRAQPHHDRPSRVYGSHPA